MLEPPPVAGARYPEVSIPVALDGVPAPPGELICEIVGVWNDGKLVARSVEPMEIPPLDLGGAGISQELRDDLVRLHSARIVAKWLPRPDGSVTVFSRDVESASAVLSEHAEVEIVPARWSEKEIDRAVSGGQNVPHVYSAGGGSGLGGDDQFRRTIMVTQDSKELQEYIRDNPAGLIQAHIWLNRVEA